jgi:type IV secretion system protein VirB8
MLKKKNTSDGIDRTVNQSVNFEISIADLAKRSERHAWWVAASALVMSLALAGGYFYVLPLKEKVPYLIMADAYTGTSTLTHLTEDVTEHQLSANEAINRSNIAHFILARESYDAALTALRDWSTVLTMSSSGVAAEYTNLYTSRNPKSPVTLYGRDTAIRVKILSIVLIGGRNGSTPKGATVRFQRSLYSKVNGSTRVLDNKLATLDFVYKPNLRMDDQRRVENPLGFQVTNYRVDNDYASTVPEEVPAPSATSATVPSAELPAATTTVATSYPAASENNTATNSAAPLGAAR